MKQTFYQFQKTHLTDLEKVFVDRITLNNKSLTTTLKTFLPYLGKCNPEEIDTIKLLALEGNYKKLSDMELDWETTIEMALTRRTIYAWIGALLVLIGIGKPLLSWVINAMTGIQIDNITAETATSITKALLVACLILAIENEESSGIWIE